MIHCVYSELTGKEFTLLIVTGINIILNTN